MARVPHKHNSTEPLRFSWFSFYVDDWLGGTQSMTNIDRACYLTLLLAQWASKYKRAITPDVARLTSLCHGDVPSSFVLAKFDPVEVDGQPMLRNARLAAEWDTAAGIVRRSQAGGDGRGKQQQLEANERSAKGQPNPSQNPSQNPAVSHPTSHIPHTTTHNVQPQPTTGSPGGSPVSPPPYSQASDRAEAATSAEIRKLQNDLGSRLAALAEHENSRDTVTTWCRRVTSYTDKQGHEAKGAADYRTIFRIDRLEHSIADADYWLKKLAKGPLKEKPHGT
jgi:hypothetical protein